MVAGRAGSALKASLSTPEPARALAGARAGGASTKQTSEIESSSAYSISRAPPAPRDLFRPETSIGVAPEPPPTQF